MSSCCSAASGLDSVMAAKEAQIHAQITFAIAAKSLQAQKLQGEAAVQLLEAAASMSRELGKGQVFDAVG